MATSTSELIVRIKDEASKQAGGIADALGKIGAAEKGIQSAQMKALTDQLAKAQEATSKVANFRAAQEKLKATRRQFNEAQTAVQNAAKALASSTDETSRKMQSAMRRAQSEVKKTAAEYANASAKAKAAYGDIGGSVDKAIGAEKRLREQIQQTTEAIKSQAVAEEAAAVKANARQRRREIIGGGLATAGIYGAYKAREFGREAIVSAADFDLGVRKQRFYTSTSEEDQNNILIPQAKRIGQETQFTNLDIVESQTAVMQRLSPSLPRAKVAAGITEEVKNYALAMNADMKASAEAITSFLQQTQKDISTQEKAVKEARRATNMMIRMAKIGGMSDEDIQNFFSYAGASATIAGLSDTTIGALGVGMRRSGFRGDVAGVALRSFSSKLVSPTSKGLAALDSMGINFDDYTTAPEKMTSGAIGGAMKRNFGKLISEATAGAIEEILGDPDLMNDGDAFTAAMTEAVTPEFGEKMGAKDRNAVAKMFSKYYKMSVASTDTEGLLAAILAADPSLAQLNAFFTDKHGGKAGVLAANLGAIAEDRKDLGSVPDNYGAEISAGIMGGLGGSFERLKGSVENATLAMGEANSKWLSYTFEGVGNTIDAFSNLSEPVRQTATALGTLAAGAGFTLGSLKLLGTFFGGGAGLKGSAVALDGSAAALTRAAMALGGSSVTDGIGGPAGKGKGGWLTRLMGAGGGMIPQALLYGMGSEAIDTGFDAISGPKPNTDHSTIGTFKRLWNDMPPLIGRRAGTTGVDGSALDQTKSKADAASDAVYGLGVTVRPNVDTTSLDEAIGKLSQLSSSLGSVNAGIGRTSRGVDQKLRAIHADTGVTGVGHQ